MWFTEEKLAKHINDLKERIYRDQQDLTGFKYIEGDFEELQHLNGHAEHPEFDDSGWNDFAIGDYWGAYDKSAWFRTKVSIPEPWRHEKLALRFLVGPRDGGGSTAETLLYVEGKPLQGIDIWHEEAWLPPELVDKGTLHLALKAWSSVLKVPERRRFKLAQLVVIDEPTEKLYFLADTLLQTIKELGESDLRRTKLLKSLNQALLKLDFIRYGSDAFYTSVREAYAMLSADVSELSRAEEFKPKVIGFGHSHIDMAWLWRLAHSREKASRTFSTVLHLMKQYPEYRFLHTSPQLYKYLKKDFPQIYEQVKARIASGEWEITGGMWIEPDTNVPSGESLVRQILFGKRFIKQEFGQETNVVFLPDVFGYSWALPQIIRRSGIDNFITSKISWSQYNRFPHDTFMWRGVDGTDVLTHYITTPEVGSRQYTYNGLVDPYEVKGTWDQYKQKDVNEELIMAFGWGDGGGGPTKDMLEAAEVMKNLPGLPRFELGKMEPYLTRLHERVKPEDLPLWDGELYLEYHRGTYTSQAWIKKANRESEILYHNAEWLNVAARAWAGQADYPQERLNEGWEMILLNHFHDILPGSSIRQVYEDSRKEYELIREIGEEAAEQAKQSLAGAIGLQEDGLLLYNPISWKRGGLIPLPYRKELEIAGVSQTIEEDGAKSLLLQVDGVPSLGYKAVTITELEKATSGTETLTVQPDLLENSCYRIALNAQGHIVSLFDKRSHREVVAKGQRVNVLQAFEDRPMNFDAWDIDIYYQEKLSEVTELIEAVVEESGPLRGVLRLTWRFHHSSITQSVTIYRDSPRIDFRTVVDWQEKRVLLKVAFPVDVRSTRATYDIQFGNIERPTHWNTSWDVAKFEVAAQKWADLSEGNYGVALLNDCKYGHDIRNNVMRLTLIKSPVEPDETADRGRHEFTYALLPHAGDWRQAEVAKAAYELNYPLLAQEVKAQPAGPLPSEASFAELDCDHAMIETIKKAEDDDACVVRLYEYKQYRADGIKLRFDRPIRQAVECNLVEEEEAAMQPDGHTLTFSIKPYEVKTYKVWF